MSLATGAALAATLLAAAPGATSGEAIQAQSDGDAVNGGDAVKSGDDGHHTRFIPLPLYATVPNEGSTYGVMPVFLRTATTGAAAPADSSSPTSSPSSSSGGIYAIIAPSASWNAAAGVSGTFRYYGFLDPVRSYSLIASFSTRINRTLWFQYDDIRREPHGTTLDLTLLARRNLFYRFFGLGPDSTAQGESSYTRTTAIAYGRWGYNLSRDVNIGPFAEIRADRPERHAIFGLPALQDLYPGAPGLGGAALARQGLSLRFDTREAADYSTNGLASELAIAVAEGITGVSTFGQITWNTRALFAEAPYLQFGTRAYWTQILGGDSRLPFYYRPSLGGELFLRGYNEDRFVDFGAWELDVEQRIRLLETHLFDVTTDWRLDPFVSAGQVYSGAAVFSHVRITGGAGLRIWVHPNVLGRIDLAYSDEGFQAYVVLGYPF